MAGENVVVAISGGVDSAVAALFLKKAGYHVQALHMTNWDDADGYCTAADDAEDARRLCERLDIPLHRVNFAQQYRQQVFTQFLQELRAGRTPNPDILCNREIKFGAFRDYARRLGAEFFATGHYARLSPVDGGAQQLMKGLDRSKDQSYFLHAVGQRQFEGALFPLGELSKDQVRRTARQAGLHVAEKRDSTGICFIGERPFERFLREHLSAPPGDMVDDRGRTVGRHRGLPYYTIGQRQGLGIGGRRSGDGAPWYVAGKTIETNTLTVVQGADHPSLFSAGLEASRETWVNDPPRFEA